MTCKLEVTRPVFTLGKTSPRQYCSEKCPGKQFQFDAHSALIPRVIARCGYFNVDLVRTASAFKRCPQCIKEAK